MKVVKDRYLEESIGAKAPSLLKVLLVKNLKNNKEVTKYLQKPKGRNSP
jgi:hypothetical protein